MDTMPEQSPNTRRSPALYLILFMMVMGIGFAVAVIASDSGAAQLEQAPASVMSSLMNTFAPDFERNLLSGETVRLSDYRGRIVFLNFWATWCPPCRDEMPAIQTFLDEQRGDDSPIVLAVNNAEAPDLISGFYTEIGVRTIPTILDPTGELNDTYGVVNMPVTYVLDRAGVIRAVKIGEMTLEDMDAYVEAINQLEGGDDSS